MNDLVNGLFELIGSMFLALNIVRLHKDKKVQGVSVLPTIFWTLWGFWNLYFYPSVGCIYSFVGGVFVVIMNLVWVIMALYYRSN
jgi:hypothetical protein